MIGRTWDGLSIPSDDLTVVTLVPSADHGGLEIEVDACFRDDPPPDAPPGPTPRLWTHEVVELFVAGGAGGVADADEPDRPPYTEIELGPHGHYLVLRFRGARRPLAEVDETLAIDYRSAVDGRRWRGRAVVPLDLLPPAPHRAAAFAIHGPAADRRHLAAHPLPGAAPDFHRPELFRPIDLGLG